MYVSRFSIGQWKQAPGTRPPFGYRWNRDEKRAEIDPVFRERLAAMFEAFDGGGFSLSGFVAHCNQRGWLPKSGIPWQKGRLEKLLKNPFYCGWFRYRGGVYEGSHEPYFSKERYDERLRRLAANRNGDTSSRKGHLLSRFVKCSKCGGNFIAELQHGENNSGDYTYYKHRCRGGQNEQRIRESDLLARIDAAVEQSRFSPAFGESLKELFRKPLHRRNKKNRREAAALTARIGELNERKSRLYDLFTIQEIDKLELVEKRREYEAQIQLLQKQRAYLEQDDKRVFNRIVETIELLREIPTTYLGEGRPAEKIKILKTMAVGMRIAPGGSLAMDWRTPYGLLMNCPEMPLAIKEDRPARLARAAASGAGGKDGDRSSIESPCMLGGGRKLNSCGLSPIEQMIVDYKFWMASGESGTM